MTKRTIKIAALAALANGDFANAAVASTSGGIEAQERAGRDWLVSNSVLPIECLRCERHDFEALGIVYGDPIDDLFVSVQFPDGWSVRATDHDMNSELVDATGAVRGHVFYKAAFYDRRAHIALAT